VNEARHSAEPQILSRRTGSGPEGEQFTPALLLNTARHSLPDDRTDDFAPTARMMLAYRTTFRKLRFLIADCPCRIRRQAATKVPLYYTGFSKFAAAIAIENRNMDELFNAVMLARMLETDGDGQVIRWIRSMVDECRQDSEYRKNAEELIQRWLQRQDGKTFDGDIQTTYKQIHQNILTSAGIDPAGEPWVSLIDIAVKDDDPTRVPKECQEKVISYHPLGDPNAREARTGDGHLGRNHTTVCQTGGVH
jgi:hypothetical protein